MGYYNSFEHKYNETDFFKALYLANQPKYKNTLFFIILDEMNLSRPEHYFADFLSILEQSESERFISLTKTPEGAWPNSLSGGKLRVPENVRFIGTANHDETTLEFAPKTYDRSNLMEMPKNHSGKPRTNYDAVNFNFNVTYPWLKDQFSKGVSKHRSQCDQFKAFINDSEFKILIEDKGIGVGNRLEDQAEKFIGVYLESGSDPLIDLAVATDHLITSRIFRTLKNRYELSKGDLIKFRDDYVSYFERTFNKQNPEMALNLLNVEINKK
jgi:hypothetical protein